jgi:hypothetical protein
MDRHVYTFMNSSDIFSYPSNFNTKSQKNLISSTTLASCYTLISSLWTMFIKNKKQFLNSNTFLLPSDLSVCPLMYSWAPPTSSSKSELPLLHPWLPSQAFVLPYFFRRHLLNSTSMRRHPPSSFAPPFSYTPHSTQPKNNTSHASHAQSVLTTFQNDKIRRPHQWRWQLD